MSSARRCLLHTQFFFRKCIGTWFCGLKLYRETWTEFTTSLPVFHYTLLALKRDSSGVTALVSQTQCTMLRAARSTALQGQASGLSLWKALSCPSFRTLALRGKLLTQVSARKSEAWEKLDDRYSSGFGKDTWQVALVCSGSQRRSMNKQQRAAQLRAFTGCVAA